MFLHVLSAKSCPTSLNLLNKIRMNESPYNPASEKGN